MRRTSSTRSPARASTARCAAPSCSPTSAVAGLRGTGHRARQLAGYRRARRRAFAGKWAVERLVGYAHVSSPGSSTARSGRLATAGRWLIPSSASPATSSRPVPFSTRCSSRGWSSDRHRARPRPVPPAPRTVRHRGHRHHDATAPTGVPQGMTASSLASVSLQSAPGLGVHRPRPPTCTIPIAASERFVVNILESGQEALSRRFADQHEDRFEGVGYHRSPEGLVLLDGALAHIECERHATYAWWRSHDHRGPGDRWRHGGWASPPLLSRRLRDPGMTSILCTLSPVGTELLDDPGADPAAVDRVAAEHRARQSLVRRKPRRSSTASRRVLSGISRGTSLTLLDLGTGAGDLPLAAARRAARQGHPPASARARAEPGRGGAGARGGRPLRGGRAGAPPFGPKSVDVVLVSQVLHHLDAGSAVRLLRACDRLARLGVVVSDLRRGSLAPLAFWFGSHALRFDRYTRTDGLTSIRRGYSAGELRELLRTAGRRRKGVAPAGVSPGRRPGEPAADAHRGPASGCARRWSGSSRPRRTSSGGPRSCPTTAGSGCWSAVDGGGVVEMAAWRPFGLVSYPTWWVSEMWVDRGAPAVHYRHVRGITTGMDVVWHIEPAGRRDRGDDRARLDRPALAADRQPGGRRW